ncbi:unnamed protein product [Rhizophagus irregularis]|nr:unnamed protein product [Rhizophagus irregularis]
MVESIFREFPNAVEEIRRILRHLLKQCKDETLKHLKDLHKWNTSSSKQESNDLRSIVDLGSKIFDMMYDDDADEEEFEKLKMI